MVVWGYQHKLFDFKVTKLLKFCSHATITLTGFYQVPPNCTRHSLGLRSHSFGTPLMSLNQAGWKENWEYNDIYGNTFSFVIRTHLLNINDINYAQLINANQLLSQYLSLYTISYTWNLVYKWFIFPSF